MHIQTGVDIVEIERVEKSMRNPRFVYRILGEEERARWGEAPCALKVAGAFAAKEAFSKAMGTGIRGFGFQDVQLLNDALGKPYLKLSGRAQVLCSERGARLDVSISHCRQYCVAFVVAYGG